MTLYSVTYSVDEDHTLAWLTYLKEIHNPLIMSTGLLVSCAVFRILFEVQNGAVSYNCQYHFAKREDYDTYREKYNLKHKYTMLKQFKGKFNDFNALLEEI